MSQYIAANQASQKQFYGQLKKYYSFYTVGFIVFLVFLAIAEQMGMSKKWMATGSSSRPSPCTPASAS